MASMNNNLQPCPFCGSEDLTEEATGASEVYGYEYQACWIECNSCGTSGPVLEVTDNPKNKNTYQDVRNAWNTRK